MILLEHQQRPSCKVTDKMCNEIDNCKAIRKRFYSVCTDVLNWERASGMQPQCSNECKEAIMTWADSEYENVLCCNCLHNEMSAREKHVCIQTHRNIAEICKFRINSTCEVSAYSL